MPGRVEDRLQPPVHGDAAASGSGWNTPARLVAAAEQRRVPAVRCRPGAQRLARRRRAPSRPSAARRPTRSAASPPRSAYGAVGLDRQPPQRAAGRARRHEERMRLLAHAAPEDVVVRREPRRRRCVATAASTAGAAPDRRTRRRPPCRQVADSGSGCPPHSFRLGGSPRPAAHSNTRVASALGRGRHLSEISSSTPSVPSAPVISRATSKPATFFITRPPNVRSSPRPSRMRTPSTRSRTAPA